MTEILTVTELADKIHQHQTEDYACYFKLKDDANNNGSSVFKVLVAADEGNFVLWIRSNDNSKKMAFRLFVQPTSVSIYKCLLMFFWHYLRFESDALVVAENVDSLQQ